MNIIVFRIYMIIEIIDSNKKESKESIYLFKSEIKLNSFNAYPLSKIWSNETSHSPKSNS